MQSFAGVTVPGVNSNLPGALQGALGGRSHMLDIGIDLGTSAVKLLLMDGKGEITSDWKLVSLTK